MSLQFYIVGDINMNIGNDNPSILKEFFENNNLKNSISKPTRIAEKRK